MPTFLPSSKSNNSFKVGVTCIIRFKVLLSRKICAGFVQSVLNLADLFLDRNEQSCTFHRTLPELSEGVRFEYGLNLAYKAFCFLNGLRSLCSLRWCCSACCNISHANGTNGDRER